MTKAELEQELIKLKSEQKFVHKLKEVVVLPEDKGGNGRVIALCTCGYAARVTSDNEKTKLYDHYLEANKREKEINNEVHQMQ